MEPNEIVTRTAITRLGPDGLVRVTTLPGSDQVLADAQDNMRALEALAKEKPRPMLLDIRQMKSQNRESRLFYGRPENTRMVKAVAIVVDSPMSRVFGNFVMGFSKASSPTRLFTSEAEAETWLRSFVE
ncbi:MAG: STAS/SEC14 domain-containing protein [Oscillochloris sp.]|nr:STAS/SEC14 domain-containing protein [Oscillochloris sp.]